MELVSIRAKSQDMVRWLAYKGVMSVPIVQRGGGEGGIKDRCYTISGVSLVSIRPMPYLHFRLQWL